MKVGTISHVAIDTEAQGSLTYSYRSLLGAGFDYHPGYKLSSTEVVFRNSDPLFRMCQILVLFAYGTYVMYIIMKSTLLLFFRAESYNSK